MLSPNITASDVNKGEPWLYCHSYTDRLRRKTKGQHHVIFFSHKTFKIKKLKRAIGPDRLSSVLCDDCLSCNKHSHIYSDEHRSHYMADATCYFDKQTETVALTADDLTAARFFSPDNLIRGSIGLGVFRSYNFCISWLISVIWLHQSSWVSFDCRTFKESQGEQRIIGRYKYREPSK